VGTILREEGGKVIARGINPLLQLSVHSFHITLRLNYQNKTPIQVFSSREENNLRIIILL